jgi:hypothetical protein
MIGVRRFHVASGVAQCRVESHLGLVLTYDDERGERRTVMQHNAIASSAKARVRTGRKQPARKRRKTTSDAVNKSSHSSCIIIWIASSRARS